LVPALCFLAGVVVALGAERLLTMARGNPQETRVLSYQDWRVICSPAMPAVAAVSATVATETTPARPATPAIPAVAATCRMVQDVVRPEGGSLLQIALPLDTMDRLMVTVPHGVMLEPGLGFAVGQGATPAVHPYLACTEAGCVASVPLDAATLKLMRENTDGRVSVVPGNGTPVGIPFSLRGFANGYAALAREGSWF
jgi:invasion protein IalB